MKKYILGTGISLCLLMSSCLNDSFLEVYPKGQQTDTPCIKWSFLRVMQKKLI